MPLLIPYLDVSDFGAAFRGGSDVVRCSGIVCLDHKALREAPRKAGALRLNLASGKGVIGQQPADDAGETAALKARGGREIAAPAARSAHAAPRWRIRPTT